MKNRKETIDLIETKYRPTKSRAGLEYEATQIANLVRAEQVNIGYMYPGRWEHIAKVYAETSAIPENFSLDGFLYDPDPVTDLRKLYLYLSLALAIALVSGSIAAYIAKKNRQLSFSLKTGDQLRENQSHLLSMLEHELRNPMAVLRIAMTSPSVSSSTRDLGDRTIQEMEDLLQKCMQMEHVDQLSLDLRMNQCEVFILVNEICKQKNYMDKIVLHTDPSVSHYSVKTDPFLLKSIISNLIDNAIKYSSVESKIEIKLKQSLRSSTIGVRMVSKEAGVLISIENIPGSAGFPDPNTD